MPKIIVVSRSGVEHAVQSAAGLTVMEAIRAGGLDELLALCGGCCSCATCHVQIDPEHYSRLFPMGDDECDLLESSNHRTRYSRLACQIPLTEDLDGLKVTIAAED